MVANPVCPECGFFNCRGDCVDEAWRGWNQEDRRADIFERCVAHPPHYTQGKIEVIDFIMDQDLNYNLGNVVKYVCRCRHKGTKRQDLEKAIQYLKFELDKGGSE